MSRATIIGPESERRVATGCFDSSARISRIGRRRSMRTTSPGELLRLDVGQEARGVLLELLEEDARRA